MATATPQKQNPRKPKPRATSAVRAKPSGQSGSARSVARKTAGRAGPGRAARQGLKAAAKADGGGAGKFETLTAFWRVGRLAWKVARGQRPKAKELRKAAGSASEVGAKALAGKAPKFAGKTPKLAGKAPKLAGKAPKAPGRKLGQALSGIHLPQLGQLPEHVRRLPVQQAVDVAVPLEVAYEEWMRFESLPEGAHCVKDVERRGGQLVGEVDGFGEPREWEAEIRDERPNESFAWRSTRGSDVAGLVTFHRLSERLTRIELQLDVVPTGVGEAASLALHLADRRAETELRKFKSRLETISPDAYPPSVGSTKRKTTKSTTNNGSPKRKQATRNKKPNKNKEA